MFFYHSDSLNVFQFPETFGGNYEFVDVNEVCKNIYEFKYGYADWGQFYSIDACNQYGGVQGDTIFTTSLIEDSEILRYLETIHSQIVGIDDVQDEDMRICLNNNWLVIDFYSDKQCICEWQCENHTISTISKYNIVTGRSKSCGCTRYTKRKKDIVGENFGDWTVIKVLPNEKSIMSMCLWCRKGIGKEEQTEDEIMKSYNYLKIYDCGNMKFIWNKA